MQFINPVAQFRGIDVSVPTGDEFIEGIMDEHILTLGRRERRMGVGEGTRQGDSSNKVTTHKRPYCTHPKHQSITSNHCTSKEHLGKLSTFRILILVWWYTIIKCMY